jgi:hypothetical protein
MSVPYPLYATRKKGSNGFALVKHDMSKTYDMDE